MRQIQTKLFHSCRVFVQLFILAALTSLYLYSKVVEAETCMSRHYPIDILFLLWIESQQFRTLQSLKNDHVDKISQI